jgi:hypothetical protein
VSPEKTYFRGCLVTLSAVLQLISTVAAIFLIVVVISSLCRRIVLFVPSVKVFLLSCHFLGIFFSKKGKKDRNKKNQWAEYRDEKTGKKYKDKNR